MNFPELEKLLSDMDKLSLASSLILTGLTMAFLIWSTAQ